MNRNSIFLITLISLMSVFSNAATPEFSREQVLLSVILSNLDNHHYQDMDYNNAFSEKVYDLYIKSIDSRKRFLLQSDINELHAYHHDLDESIQKLDFRFYDRSVEILEMRQTEAEKYFEDILGKPFDYTTNEAIELDPDNIDFPRNEDAMKDRWRKVLKYSTLTRILDYETMDEHEGKSFDELEKLAREKTLKVNKDWFTRIGQQDTDDKFAVFVNAVTQAVDPHTNYYPPADKDNFDIAMSGKLEGIGARLSQEGAYIKVVSIIPGSPSAKQGDLEVEDLILKVAQADDEPVDIVDMPIDDAVKMIRGPRLMEVL